jgi:hypothetical protein
MKQVYYILISFFILSLQFADAQVWSREDSLWLENVLEGKVELKINEETLKALDDGKLIIPKSLDKKNKSEFDLLNNINESNIHDSIKIQRIDPLSMPPAVFALYILYFDILDSAYNNRSIMLTNAERKQLESMIPPGTIQAFSPYTSDRTPGFTLRGLDFNHILSMLFSSNYRNRRKNVVNATSYRNYYDEGALVPITLTEYERKQLRRAVNINLRQDQMPGMKTNPIDD